MASSGVAFGTSGARGLVVDMSDLVCFAYTLGFLQYAARQENGQTFDRVAVAYDLRSSSPRIARTVCRAVEYLGLKPIDCGALPSPALAYYGFAKKIPTVMVTGSHIPEDRNGIKFTLPGGEILKADEAGIREQTVTVPDELFDSSGVLSAEETAKSVASDGGEAKRLYIDRFVRALPSDFLAGFRIGFYEHSAVGRDLLCELYTKLGASVTRLGRSDTFVSVDTEAVRGEDIVSAKRWAAGDGRTETPRFDAIVSTDGDSDRPLVFDEHGDWIRGDLTGIITARFLLADCVVTPVNSSTALELCGWFPNVVRTKIGSPYVVEAMKKAVAQGAERVVGYEANGGFLTATPILIDEEYLHPLSALPTRDTVIVLIAVLLMSKKNGVPISMLIDHLPHRITAGDRLNDFPADLAQRKMEELLLGGRETIEPTFAAFGELTGMDTTDGLRMTFGDTGDIVHLRPSGNAPEFRCYTEADTVRRAQWLLGKALDIVAQWRLG
ncbi:MAG TPA: phosphomannomutase [Planctomycetaceae bacterium]|nr:phosphomannomutase [Planctomycetaceae bacterium]